MHGWKWRLTDGKCLTSVGHDIRVCAPAGEPVPGEPIAAVVHDDHHDQHDDEDE